MKKVLHIGLCVNPNGYGSFPHAFKKVLGEDNYRELPTGEPNLNGKAIALFNEFRPDIVFMQIQAEGIIQHETCQHFKRNGAFVINWTGDKRHDVPKWMIDLAPYVSLTSFSNMEDVRKMREMGWPAEYLEIGYDPEIYTPEGEAYQMPEIVFMGNHYGDGHFPMSKFRREMVEFLQREYGSRFGVYGTGWPNPAGNFNHSQHEEAKAYRGVKFAINCSHFDCEKYNSDRLLRILGSGAMCISYRHKDMEPTFEYGTHLNYFSDLASLKECIDRLTPAKGGVKLMKEWGHELALNNFTFVHQVQNILKLAE